MRLRMKTGSWIVIERGTGRAIVELFNPALVNKVRRDRYRVVSILTYLQSLNHH